MKARIGIYNLNCKACRWWRDLKHTKKDDLREVWWTKFHNIFQEKYMLMLETFTTIHTLFGQIGLVKPLS